MNYRTQVLILVCCFAIFFESCSQDTKDGFSINENGLKYKFAEQTENNKPGPEDVITFHLGIYNETDSLLSSTYQGGAIPIMTPLPEPTFKGGLEDGLAMMAKDDSAIFFVLVDSIYKGRTELIPPNLRGSKYLQYRVRMVNVQTREEIEAEQFEKTKELRMEQEKEILAFLEARGLSAEPTTSGLYHIVTEPGSGDESPTVNSQVTVHYTGFLLDGQVFDSSVPGKMPGKMVSGDPVTFPLGGVIAGWQEGVAMMKKGEKALFVIPSYLAYGPQGSPPIIGPDAVLAFEIELIDFK